MAYTLIISVSIELRKRLKQLEIDFPYVSANKFVAHAIPELDSKRHVTLKTKINYTANALRREAYITQELEDFYNVNNRHQD